MDHRFWRVLILSIIILVGGSFINQWLFPRKAPPPELGQKPDIRQPGDKPADVQPAPGDQPKPVDAPKPAEVVPPAEAPAAEPDQSKVPSKIVTLGSLDPESPFRMLVTLTNSGAALSRIELTSPRFRDEDRSGYLGHIADVKVRGQGCLIRHVGPGTPAAQAGLRGEQWIKSENGDWKHVPGDLITAVDGESVLGPETLTDKLGTFRHGHEVTLTVVRDGKTLGLPVTLGRKPLDMVHPEGNDPLSLLLTLQQLDDRQLKVNDEDRAALGKELQGVDLWTATWEIEAADEQHAVFRRTVPGTSLEIRRTYRLAVVPEESLDAPLYRAYHLEMDIEIRNAGEKAHTVAYQLDGPNGLPLLGKWFTSKVSPSSGVAGMRDVLISFRGEAPLAIHTTTIAKGEVEAPYESEPVTYAGVDTQYFAAMLVPKLKTPADDWFARSHAIRVGAVNKEDVRFTNVSCRLISKPHELAPGETLAHTYTLFAGPKRPDLLTQYGLDRVVYYGWPIFAMIAVPLVKILHTLYWLVPNYGVAIILLTVLVRGCMFPLSRKQALNAQKMMELQPEIKKIQEKYKKDVEGRTKAQQELFRKHNYNPLGGCLLLFIQLPIFIGLYRALMIDVDLWQAPLFTEQIRWCSNLAAPDMFYDWSWRMPDWVNSGMGLFALGPYLNVLPILTVIVFTMQQKLMMPPPADEQQALQQKIMKYMMLFMGVLFYKVASGLCIYFIASSLWGLAERKFLPKTTPIAGPPQTRADAKADARAAAERENKVRKK